jgi:spermidine synthase
LQAIFIAGLPLLAATFLLFHSFQGRHHFRFILLTGTALVILGAGIIIEPLSLVPGEGKRVYYCETRYGRIEVHQDKEQFTLFEDGIPLFSNQNLVVAEEAIHYPLSQTAKHENVLLISVESGMMAELKKYRPKAVDYVELNPEVTTVLFRFGMIKDILGLRVIHQDGRVYLRDSYKHYDAVIVNLPEPVTFQINRFYTDEFFALAKNRLAPRGVLSFSMEGFENYLSEPQRRKLSSLYNTVKDHFNHVLMLPGQKIFFLCSDRPIRTDIPACLAEKGIATRYISQYYYGNVTRERIRDLNDLTDPAAPKNIDIYPQLMRLMFSQWFAKFSTSPVGFVVALALLVFIYMIRITREEFLLFSTGCMTMGSEIIVIFAFQIFFGYIYSQIGMIVTFFLAGLLPGAWFGEQLSNWGRRVLIVTDMILIFLMGLFMLVLRHGWDRLPVSFFLVFGFVVSLVCGCQFPVAFKLRGGDNPAAVRSFSADLIGAACGTLFISVVLIPYFGIGWAMAGLIGLKLASLFTIGIDYAKNKPTSVSLL